MITNIFYSLFYYLDIKLTKYFELSDSIHVVYACLLSLYSLFSKRLTTNCKFQNEYLCV